MKFFIILIAFFLFLPIATAIDDTNYLRPFSDGGTTMAAGNGNYNPTNPGGTLCYTGCSETFDDPTFSYTSLGNDYDGNDATFLSFATPWMDNFEACDPLSDIVHDNPGHDPSGPGGIVRLTSNLETLGPLLIGPKTIRIAFTVSANTSYPEAVCAYIIYQPNLLADSQIVWSQVGFLTGEIIVQEVEIATDIGSLDFGWLYVADELPTPETQGSIAILVNEFGAYDSVPPTPPPRRTNPIVAIAGVVAFGLAAVGFITSAFKGAK